MPAQIAFQGKIFEKANHSQIDEMQQLLYLDKNTPKDPNHWQQGLLIFLDKNSQNRPLAERAELRRVSFAKLADTQASIAIKGQELQSQVIYPPTERFNDVQLEVSRGRDLQCGFGQMQFSDKRAVSGKNLQNLAAYQPALLELARQFSQLAWQIECK